MNSETSQTLRFAHVLRQSLLILGDNFLQFYLVALAVGVPTLVLTATLPPDSLIANSGIVENILSQVATGAITYGSFHNLRGQRAGALACLGYAVRKLLPLFWLSLLTGLLIGIGLLLLVVPGLIFAAMYAVAVPALMVERTGVGESMRRSTSLTKDYRWQVLALVILPMIGLIAGGLVLETILISAEMLDYGLGIDDFLIWLLSGLFYMVSAVFAAALYYRLREIKEGLGIEQLAAIFD